ncbi:hypothetical protein GXW71_05360 [Roseomonas hellenica]|uniref:Uncharacterized protein n=1 Tax=Plastoroseomonas hellenica TaxID=2687306 RepID=A0ABS5ETZ9_9PROT|nr:hypothetical protein [Plastoroseomonas hellenica]MBR0663781.1 hypothetical protein [Plastoroseomonas hellenica]
MNATRRRLICAGVLPAVLPAAAMAFRYEAPGVDDAAALAARCPSDAALSNADVAALRQAHAQHAVTAEQQKMMEEGARCPICGCPPVSLAEPAKGLL